MSALEKKGQYGDRGPRLMVLKTGLNHVDGEGHPIADPQSSFGRFSKFHAHGKLNVIHILKAMNSVIHGLVLVPLFFLKSEKHS
ncbi:hypothetical protein WUBG_02350 [Wuchereria bancrofti]|uniref:Uncharacterized protein n=1 Tax=Wuchereria bancrofti TaxID=6293 RepID=J9FHC2_WUCBA|nr:hypothetical protein WUBG_02350 [Wuchereria bancrofti]